MSAHTLRKTVVTTGYAILLLAYFLATTSCFGATRLEGSLHLQHGPWHAAIGLSLLLGGLVALFCSERATYECRAVLKRDFVFAEEMEHRRAHIQHRAVTACAVVMSYAFTYGLSLSLGLLILFRIPASMDPWYELAHKELRQIQGPVLLALVWTFYAIYWWLVRQTRNYFYAATRDSQETTA